MLAAPDVGKLHRLLVIMGGRAEARGHVPARSAPASRPEAIPATTVADTAMRHTARETAGAPACRAAGDGEGWANETRQGVAGLDRGGVPRTVGVGGAAGEQRGVRGGGVDGGP